MSLISSLLYASVRRLRTATIYVLAVSMLCVPMLASAIDANELGATADVAHQPLQELIKRKRARGLVYVTIPQARVYGEGSGYRAYCSPQIRAINASDKTVEELLVGIRYINPTGKSVGSTISRFFRVKVGKQETHYFYSTINANNCDGLNGKMEIIRCVYENGVDCTGDVRSVAYGAVPIEIVGKSKESN